MMALYKQVLDANMSQTVDHVQQPYLASKIKAIFSTVHITVASALRVGQGGCKGWQAGSQMASEDDLLGCHLAGQ